MMQTLHLVKLFKPDCIHGKFPANKLDAISGQMRRLPDNITDENMHTFLHGKTFLVRNLGRNSADWRFGFTTEANGETPGEIYCSDCSTSTKLDQVSFAKRDNIRIISSMKT